MDADVEKTSGHSCLEEPVKPVEPKDSIKGEDRVAKASSDIFADTIVLA